MFYNGIKASTCTLVTPSPTDSTTAAASWPRTHGKSPCKKSHPVQKNHVSSPPDRGRRGCRCRCGRARCWSLSLAPRQPWAEPPENMFCSDRTSLLITRSWLGVNLFMSPLLSVSVFLSFCLCSSLSPFLCPSLYLRSPGYRWHQGASWPPRQPLPCMWSSGPGSPDLGN